MMINKKHYVLATQAVLNSLDKKFVGKVTSIDDLCSVLESKLFCVFNPQDFNLEELEFAVERVYQKDISPTHIETSGEYISLEVWKRKSQIEEALMIYVSSREKLVFFDAEKWDKFKYSILQVFVHELVHVAQSRKRFGEVYNDKPSTGERMATDYLGEDDEIDAYAFNGAIDMLALERTLQDVDINTTWETIMKTGVSKKLSIEFASYYTTFESDRKILNKFLKKVYKYVLYLQTTKVKGFKYDIYQQAS